MLGIFKAGPYRPRNNLSRRSSGWHNRSSAASLISAARLRRSTIRPSACSFARRDEPPPGSIPVGEGLDHLIEQSRRQTAVIVAVVVRPLAQIVAGPERFL